MADDEDMSEYVWMDNDFVLDLPPGKNHKILRAFTEDALARHDAATAVVVLESLNLKCPQHGIRDCSPLLNGCSHVTNLRRQINKIIDAYKEAGEVNA